MTAPLNPLPASRVYTATLTSHPNTLTQVVQRIDVEVSWHQAHILALSYTLTGNCSQLQIPLARPPTRADDLWQHTCFEAFLARPDDPAYQEWNFSPSGEWALYHFRAYRERLPVKDNEPAPEIEVHSTPDGLTLNALIRLPHRLTVHPLQLALSVVIEDVHGNLSYWALKHPPDKPDFHQRDTFVLEIAPLSDFTARKEP